MSNRKTTNPAPSRRPGRPAGRTSADGVIADREKLLSTAESLIRQSGPGISLEAIALAAGVSKPILYRGVGDRDALVNALAARLAARMADAVTDLVAQIDVPKAALRSLVNGYLELAATEQHLYLFVTAGGTGDDRLQQSLALADGAAQQFADRIRAYRLANGADPSVANVFSYAMLGSLHFVTLWWLRDAAMTQEQVADQVTALLWSGLGLP